MRPDQERAIESLLNDLQTVAEDVEIESGMVRYRARPLSLFGDRVLPPEIEVLRVLEVLARHRRLTIVRQSPDGKQVLVMLRAGVELTIAPAAL